MDAADAAGDVWPSDVDDEDDEDVEGVANTDQEYNEKLLIYHTDNTVGVIYFGQMSLSQTSIDSQNYLRMMMCCPKIPIFHQTIFYVT